MRKSVLASVAAAVMLAGGVSVASAAPSSAGVVPTELVACAQANAVVNGAVHVSYPTGCTGRPLHVGWNFDFGPGATGDYDSSTSPNLVNTSLAGGYVVLWTTTGTCDYTQYVVPSGYLGEVPAPTAVGDGCSAPASSAPIPPWVQAHGRANRAASCEDGWGQSWQEWAQSITGGWVCTRSIPSLG